MLKGRGKNMRWIAMMLVSVLLVTAFAGCGGGTRDNETQTSSTAGTSTQGQTTAADPNKMDWELDTSPVTLEVFEDWPSDRESIYETPVYKRVVQDTGVSLKISTPVSFDGQKLSLMLASNSLPDLIQLESGAAWCNTFINQAVEAGKLWSFDELAEQYAPKFKSLVQPEYFNNFKSPDGKTYKYVTAINTQQTKDMKIKYGAIGAQNAVLIRKDLYEEAGSPDVTTPDGLINALKAISAKHKDLIPYTTPFDGWNNPTGPWAAQLGLAPYYLKDGKLYFGMRAPEARQVISFVNKLTTSGLMPKEALTDSPDICQKRVLNGEVISYHWNTFEEGKTVENKPDESYMALPPFTTFKSYDTSSLGGWKVMIIPKTSKLADRTIRYMEYLASPKGQEAVWWGVKGEAPEQGGKYSGDLLKGPHYYMLGDKPTFYPEFWAAKLADWDGVGKKTGIEGIPYAADSYQSFCPQWNPDDPKSKKAKELYADRIVYASEFSIQIQSDTEEGVINSKIGEIMKQYLARILFASNEQEALKQFEAMLSECDSAGLPKLEEYYNKVYQENLNSMKK